jgi:hypothetical protein
MAMSSYRMPLYQVPSRTFFDYDNRDKTIFSSDEEDNTPRERRRSRQNRSDDEGGFFSSNVGSHEGKFAVEEIPLYISKMRRELSNIKKNARGRMRGNTLDDSYFKNIKGLISMHHQNRDQVHSVYPRFSTIFYEFLAYHNIRKHNSTFDALEDNIVDVNMPNMPIPGIKNFLQAMNLTGRGRKEVLGKYKKSYVVHISNSMRYRKSQDPFDRP